MQRMRACAPSEGVVSETCRFPKLQECAHFHYERVQLCPLQISLQPQDADTSLHSQHKSSADDNADVDWYTVQVTSDSECWLLQRSYDNFVKLDSQLHQCIFDRKVSQLPDLLPNLPQEQIEDTLAAYLGRFCEIIDNSLNCGPVLTWFQLDNRGHRLLVPNEESDSINTPAVAAAYSIKKYVSQARDELNLEVGDMISVIDMASPGESMWWRGKRGFQVGFFPQHCVHVIGEKLACLPNAPSALGATVSPIKPVLRKHGKLIAFFRSFILNRPSRRRLKQSGILRERVFGCDLGEHLLNSGHEIPMVLKCCAEFIESHGIVDGIYRLSGVTSNIQKLRNAFDEDRIPNLYTDDILQDIHSVASLLKMYFRELPNPLCTYQLYHSFVNAIQGSQVNSNGVQNKVDESERLLRIRETVHKLPPPHYRTLEYLMRHLARVAKHGSRTGMTSRNVAIVWAPNLLRCAELEVGGVAALQGVGVQAVVTEFLICYADLIFCDNLPNVDLSNDGPSSLSPKKSRPKSLAISTPTKLLSLEEARSKHLINKSDECNYIEVGGGPKNLPEKYHTVLELPQGFRKRGLSKRSPLGWRSFFTKSRNNSHNNLNKNTRKASTPGITTTDKSVTESDLTEIRRKLRPVKSAESLISGQSEPPNNEIDILGPLHCLNKPSGHNRSVSHDSYFDTLQASNNNSEGSLLDLSEIQLNFELEESEMRIFSEDESLVSSPRVNRDALSRKILHRARPEEYSSTTNSSNPSPKKQPRVVLSPENQSRKRSRLEDQLSDILYIDCNTPDNTICTTAMIHSFPEKSMQIEDCSDEIGPKNKSPRNSDCSVITECTEPTVTSDPGNSESYKYSNFQKGKNRISLNLESCQRIEPNIPKSLTEADVRTGSLKVPDNGSSGIPSTNLSPQTPNYKRLIAETDSSENTTPNQLSPDFSLTESPTNISYKNLNRFSGESQKYEDLTDVSDVNNTTATYENVISDSNGKLTPKKSPASPSYENVLTTISITYSLNSPSKSKSFENSLTKDGNIYEDIEVNSDSSEHPITFTTKVTNLDEVLAQQTKINLNSSNENSSVKDITSSVNTTLINNQSFELNSKKPESNIHSSNCNMEKTMLNSSSSAKNPIRPSSVNLNPNQNENKIFRQTQSLNNSPVITPSLSVFYQNNTENKNNIAITQPTNKILQNVDDTTAPVKQQINIYENLSCFKSQSQSNISNKPNNTFVTLSNPTLSKSAVISSPTKSLPVNEKRKSCETEFNNDEDAIYQQVKYFRRSIHEINELLDKPYMLEAKESDQILNNLPETFSANDIMVMNNEQERIEVIGNKKALNDSQLSKELKSSEGESISELSVVEIISLDSVENNKNESDVKSQNIAQNNLHIVQNEKPDIESVNIVQVKDSDDIFNHQQYEEQCKVSEMLMSETDTDNVESTSEKFDSLEIKETECNLYENVSFNNMDDSKVHRDRSEKIKTDLRSNENCNIKENIVLNKIESVKLKQDLNVHNSEKCKSKSQIDNGHNVRKLTSKFESAGITDELSDKNKDVYSGRDSLPPCLRARHAKLLKNNSKTRSLDENAFMKEFGHCANDSCSTDIVLRRKSFDERSNRFSSNSKPKSLNQPKTLPDLFKKSLNFHSLHTVSNSHLQNNSVDKIKESLNKEPLSLQTNLQHSFETNKSKANSPVKNLSRHSPMDLSPSTETCSHINDSSEMNFKISSNSISSNKSNDSFTDTNVISNLETNVSNIPQLAADSNTDSHLDNPQLNRERIEKYKEERRNFLREKYRSESFRVEKDQVLSRLKQKTKSKYEHDDPDTVKDNLEYIDVLDISNKIDTHDSFMKRLGTENNYPNEKNPNEIYIDRSTKNKKSPELRNKNIGRLSDIYSKSVLSDDSYELHTNQRFKTRDPLCSTEYDLNRKALKKNTYDRDNKINDGHVDVDVKTTWKKKSNGENKFDEKNTESLKQKYEAESKNRTDCKIINDKTELDISERGAKKRDITESKKVENIRRRDLDKMAVVDARTDRRHTFDNLISRERESETERNRRIGLESRLMTRSPKKEKRSPSYCIKDMTAIFESKSNQS